MRSQIYFLLLVIIANAAGHADYRLMGHWDVSIFLFRTHVAQESRYMLKLGFSEAREAAGPSLEGDRRAEPAGYPGGRRHQDGNLHGDHSQVMQTNPDAPINFNLQAVLERRAGRAQQDNH